MSLTLPLLTRRTLNCSAFRQSFRFASFVAFSCSSIRTFRDSKSLQPNQFARMTSTAAASKSILGPTHASQHANVKAAFRAEGLVSSNPLQNTLKFEVASAASATSVSTLVIFTTSEALNSNSFIPAELSKVIPADAVKLNKTQLIDFKAEAKSSLTVYPSSGSVERLILIGLGSETKKPATLVSFRSAVAKAVDVLKGYKSESAFVSLAGVKLSDAAAASNDLLDVAARTAVLTNHVFDKYLTLKPKHRISKLTFLVADASDAAKATLTSAQTIAECTVLARELANDRADTVTPAYLETQALQLAATHAADGLSVRVLQHDELLSHGLTMITAVGQGAVHRARLILIEYNGTATGKADAKEVPRLALVGKGITFDTGGLNIKPTGGIETMYLDMHGSATVFSTMKALATLKLPVNVVGVMCLAENAVDQHSVKPHSIVYTSKGAVQISNTDAEGRLALADGMTFVQSQYKVTHMIDIATLTGACVVALGEHLAGLFSNSDALVGTLLESGTRVHERGWRMPILDEHDEELKTHYADISTTGGRMGGASLAAAFLRKFVNEGVEWCHVDIAGAGMYSKQREWVCQGGTGFGVQLFVEFIMRKSKEQK